MIRSFLFQASSGVLFAASSALAVDYDVYLAAGQSNMDGRGLKSELTGSLSPYAAVQSNVKLWYAQPDKAPNGTGWVNLRPGYSVPPGYSGSFPSTTFGPEVSFGKAMAAASPGRTVAIVKVAEGGTNLWSDWNATGASTNDYHLFINQTQTALAALAGPGNTVTVRGMIWHQGESDSNHTDGVHTVQETYTLGLKKLIDAVRTDLNVPNMPFVIGELEKFNHGTAVPAAQYQVGTQGGYNTGFASSAGLTTYEGTHFDAASQVLLGQRFATALQAVPEPTTAMLFAPAAAVWLRRQRREVAG